MFMNMFLTVYLRVLHVPMVPFTVNLCLPVCLGTAVVVNNVIHKLLSHEGNISRGAGATRTASNALCYTNVVTNRNLIKVLLTVFTIINVDLSVSNIMGLKGVNNIILVVVVVLSLLGFSV